MAVNSETLVRDFDVAVAKAHGICRARFSVGGAQWMCGEPAPFPIRLLTQKAGPWDNYNVGLYGDDATVKGGYLVGTGAREHGFVDIARNTVVAGKMDTPDAAHYFVRYGRLLVRERGEGREGSTGTTLSSLLSSHNHELMAAVADERRLIEIDGDEDDIDGLQTYAVGPEELTALGGILRMSSPGSYYWTRFANPS